MKKISLFLMMSFFVLNMDHAFSADGLQFALVPKVQNIPFFREIEKGCKDKAKQSGVFECVYQGPLTSDFRLQDRIISKLLDEGIDGIAVSVINSEFLANNSLKKAKILGIPVITFDSDLSDEVLSRNPLLREAYVGTDNRAMGMELGRALSSLQSGGSYAIISGNAVAPNLRERIVGLRDILNKNNWKEFSRSPIFVNEDQGRALKALSFMYKASQDEPRLVNAVISVSASLQSKAEEYLKTVLPFENKIKAKDFIVASADTSPHQMELLESGQSNLNVGQNTYEMGVVAISILHQIYRGFKVKEKTYTSLKICIMGRKPLCRASQ